MFYQLRLAETKDMNAIEAFLKKAGTSHKGLEEAKSQFIMMEDPPDEIVACLGMEEFENKKGLRARLSCLTSSAKATSFPCFKACRYCAKSEESKPFI